MSLIAKNEGNIMIEKLTDGVYTAISSMLVDLGMQKNNIDGNIRRKFLIVWNIVGETIEINGEKLPRVISKEYTLSLNDKSNLRKDLQAWRGKPFTEEELQGFDVKNILNTPCQLQIINEEKNGKTYTNIASIMGLPKGMNVEKLEEVIEFYIANEETWENLKKLPKWMVEKIKKSEGFEETSLKNYIEKIQIEMNEEEPEEVDLNKVIESDDDLPF